MKLFRLLFIAGLLSAQKPNSAPLAEDVHYWKLRALSNELQIIARMHADKLAEVQSVEAEICKAMDLPACKVDLAKRVVTWSDESK